MNQYMWIDIALNAQKAVIKNWLLMCYVGSRYKIGTWDDHLYSISHFYAQTCDKDLSLSARRRAMDKLAAQGIIERTKRYKHGSVIYKFPRLVCDQFAQEAINEYLALGYNQHVLTAKMPLQAMEAAA